MNIKPKNPMNNLTEDSITAAMERRLREQLRKYLDNSSKFPDDVRYARENEKRALEAEIDADEDDVAELVQTLKNNRERLAEIEKELTGSDQCVQASTPERASPQCFPIETAPDGDDAVLVWHDNVWKLAFRDGGSWYGDHHSDYYANELDGVTHWMHMPPPPPSTVEATQKGLAK